MRVVQGIDEMVYLKTSGSMFWVIHITFIVKLSPFCLPCRFPCWGMLLANWGKPFLESKVCRCLFALARYSYLNSTSLLSLKQAKRNQLRIASSLGTTAPSDSLHRLPPLRCSTSTLSEASLLSLTTLHPSWSFWQVHNSHLTNSWEQPSLRGSDPWGAIPNLVHLTWESLWSPSSEAISKALITTSRPTIWGYTSLPSPCVIQATGKHCGPSLFLILKGMGQA